MSRTNSAGTQPASTPLTFLQVLFEGHSNTVILVQNPKTKKQLVAKILNDNSADCINSFKREARFMAQLDHTNVLKSEGFVENLVIVNEEGQELNVPGILMEYAPNGDMFDLLTHFNQLPPIVARSYARQMVESTAFFHSKGIAHLDLKLENFFLDANYTLKVADFGHACKTNSEKLHEGEIGTPDYWSPEQHEKKPFNGFKSDVFALGQMFFIMVAGRMPFEKATKEDEYYSKFYNGDVDGFWQMHEEDMGFSSSSRFFKDEFRTLINGMLNPNMAERMTINEVLDHPWLKISPEVVDKCGGVVAEFLKKKCRIN